MRTNVSRILEVDGFRRVLGLPSDLTDAAFLGLPPSLPFALEAARLSLLLDWPPILPSLDAIHFFEPRESSKRERVLDHILAVDNGAGHAGAVTVQLGADLANELFKFGAGERNSFHYFWDDRICGGGLDRL